MINLIKKTNTIILSFDGNLPFKVVTLESCFLDENFKIKIQSNSLLAFLNGHLQLLQ